MSGEMAGTLASPANNLSRSIVKEAVLPRLLRKKANSEMVLVQLDKKEHQPVTKLCKNTKREQNGPRVLPFFHQKTPKEKKKKKRIDDDKNDTENKNNDKSNNLELSYIGSRAENTL